MKLVASSVMPANGVAVAMKPEPRAAAARSFVYYSVVLCFV